MAPMARSDETIGTDMVLTTPCPRHAAAKPGYWPASSSIRGRITTRFSRQASRQGPLSSRYLGGVDLWRLVFGIDGRGRLSRLIEHRETDHLGVPHRPECDLGEPVERLAHRQLGQ